ncbi:helix-turn-helix transcriptional regulator [Zymobacter palmae]|uniref:DNA-binding HTH domain-containing proteins n=1 Tax=Zymobacter palmae TaxID=33074 RepID=A0A348HDB0_9GAMM|nr:LuxR family transcriptional regulator [Zymobacter palmae]BBG29612.1 DNA-binding HTH domain-containing proteins [Zymobacter palmae]
MNNWQVDLFTGLGRADTVQDIVDVTAKIIKPIGFEYCGFRLLFPLPLSRPQLITTYTAEDEMYEKERNGGYLETPMSVHCSQSMTPFVWEGTTEDSVFKQMPEVFEEYYGYGHRGGWAQSLIEKQNMYSLFYADSSTSMTAAHLERVTLKMEWVATAVLSRLNQIKHTSGIQLSLREKEVLRWTGDGKTADQIAEILMLSPSTINFHLRKAMQKLDAPNKTAAVVRAIFLRLLF